MTGPGGFSNVFQRDPRCDTHVLRDVFGVQHQLVMSGDGGWHSFCLCMDDVEDRLRAAHRPAPMAGYAPYGDEHLVVDILTCVRCVAGLAGWSRC